MGNALNLYFSYRDFTQGTLNPFLFSVHFFWHVESYIPISRNLVLYWNLHKQSTSRKRTWEQFYFYPHPLHSAGALFVDVKFEKNENNSNTLYLEEHPALWVLKTTKAAGETCYFGIRAGAAALGRSCLQDCCVSYHMQERAHTARTSDGLYFVDFENLQYTQGLFWSSAHPENLLCWELRLFLFTVRAPGRLWSQGVKHLRLDLPPEVYRFKREYIVGILDGSRFNG